MISDIVIVWPNKMAKPKNPNYLVYGLALLHRGGHYQALHMFPQSFYHRQLECYLDCNLRIEILIKNCHTILWIKVSIFVSHFDV